MRVYIIYILINLTPFHSLNTIRYIRMGWRKENQTIERSWKCCQVFWFASASKTTKELCIMFPPGWYRGQLHWSFEHAQKEFPPWLDQYQGFRQEVDLHEHSGTFRNAFGFLHWNQGFRIVRGKQRQQVNFSRAKTKQIVS